MKPSICNWPKNYRFALGGNPYTVEFYLVTHNKQSQKSEHHTLGSFYNFTAPVVSDCENCKVQKNSGVKAKAQVPITLPLQGLVRRSYLDDIVSIEKSRVEKLLKHQLVYSVTKVWSALTILWYFAGPLPLTIYLVDVWWTDPSGGCSRASGDCPCWRCYIPDGWFALRLQASYLHSPLGSY